jgi:hypothetical protein
VRRFRRKLGKLRTIDDQLALHRALDYGSANEDNDADDNDNEAAEEEAEAYTGHSLSPTKATHLSQSHHWHRNHNSLKLAPILSQSIYCSDDGWANSDWAVPAGATPSARARARARGKGGAKKGQRGAKERFATIRNMIDKSKKKTADAKADIPMSSSERFLSQGSRKAAHGALKAIDTLMVGAANTATQEQQSEAATPSPRTMSRSRSPNYSPSYAL